MSERRLEKKVEIFRHIEKLLKHPTVEDISSIRDLEYFIKRNWRIEDL